MSKRQCPGVTDVTGSQSGNIIHPDNSVFCNCGAGSKSTVGPRNIEHTTTDIQRTTARENTGRHTTGCQCQVTAIDVQYGISCTVKLTCGLAVTVHIQHGVCSQTNFTGLSQSIVAVHENIAAANICHTRVVIILI